MKKVETVEKIRCKKNDQAWEKITIKMSFNRLSNGSSNATISRLKKNRRNKTEELAKGKI